MFRECNVVGRYFYDHISLLVARIKANDIDRLNRLAGFRFIGSTIRSLRFELTPDAQSRDQVGSAFAHLVSEQSLQRAFDMLRELMRTQLRGGRIELRKLRSVFGELPYLTRLVFWRAIYRQLLWPRPAEYELHVVAEQLPRASNFIAWQAKATKHRKRTSIIPVVRPGWVPMVDRQCLMQVQRCSGYPIFRRQARRRFQVEGAQIPC